MTAATTASRPCAPGRVHHDGDGQGFRTYRQGGIDLTVGRMPILDVKLEVGAVAETVEVSGEAPLVDTTQSKVAVTVQHEVIWTTCRRAARSSR